MYSRNQGRGQSRRDYGYELSDEEYEMYKYNLPPKYDGSRFRRGSRREPTIVVESPVPVEEVSQPFQRAEEVGLPAPIEEAVHTPVEVETTPVREEKGGPLSSLVGAIGYEELLIISLILAIAGGDDSGDALLLLAVLLTQK